MKKQLLIDALDALKASPDGWDFDREAQLYTAQVDAYTLEVMRAGGHSEWRVQHERYGLLIDWTPNAVAAWAKNEAIDYTRSHVLGVHEPQHAE